MKRKAYSISMTENVIERFNLGLAGLLLSLLISVLFLKLSSSDGVEQIMSATYRTAAQMPVLNLSKQSDKYYQRILGRRELFVGQSGLDIMKLDKEMKPELPKAQLIEDLQLMGIVSGKQGLQAIIMSAKTGQTFYCSGGEKINSFKVINVFENKVILEINGETEEIRL